MSDLPYCPSCNFELTSQKLGWTCLQTLEEETSVSQDGAKGLDDISFSEADAETIAEMGIGVFGNREICESYNEPGGKTCQDCSKPFDETLARESCPKCELMLPFVDNVEMAGSFPIVGPSGAGKSTYVVALHEWWKKNLVYFGINFEPAMDSRVEKKFEITRRRLIKGKAALSTTQRGVKFPYTWILNPYHEAEVGSFLCSLPDVSGEELYNFNDLLRNRQYDNAKGLVILLDGERIANAGTESWDDDPDEEESRSVEDHARMIRAMIEYFKTRKIDLKEIPVAVCVNKIDLLRERFDSVILHNQPRHRNKQAFDFGACKTRSDQVESLLLNDPETIGLIPTLRGMFEDVMFFPIATQGSDGDGRVEWRPAGVEDPFLWLLWMNDLIPGAE